MHDFSGGKLAAICLLSLGIAVAVSSGCNKPKSFDYRDALVTDEPPGVAAMMPDSSKTVYTAAVRVQDGEYLRAQSETKTVSGGAITAEGASGIRISSPTGGFNGLLVKGPGSTFTLSNATIELRGDGGSDMLGQGAGALSLGATLILKNVKIETFGKARTAAESIHHGFLKVIDSTLIANGGSVPSKGELPKSESAPATAPAAAGGTPPAGASGAKGAGGGPSGGPPAGAPISGTARAALTVDNSSSYFIRSKIIADGWGAISTDGAMGYVYVEADDSDITVLHKGYGFYSDLGSHVVLNSSRVNSGGFVGVVAGPADATLNNVTASAEGNAFMVHSVMGSPLDVSKIKVNGGTINSKEGTFLVKSANAELTVDGAKLNSANGKLLEVVKNTDKNATKLHNWKVEGVVATFKNMTAEGSLSNQDPERGLAVQLVKATLKGALTSASLSLDADSKWTSTADSTVILLGVTGVQNIDAPSGVTITATAGKGCTLKGSYKLPGGGSLRISGRAS